LIVRDEEEKLTVSPVAGTVVAASVTVSLMPALPKLRVAEPVAAELNVTLAGVRLIVKEMTVTGTVTAWVPAEVPSVPDMVTEYRPGVVEE
jgi:hypothetical protein